MIVGSLFSGIGGFDLGLERAGMTLAWHAETDDAASRVLAHHWPEVDNLGDVTSVGFRLATDRVERPSVVRADGGADSVPHGTAAPGRVDLLCGGFPCQDLSVAGRRAGLSGERSGLFYEFARIADELRPAWVVIENVPGLLSSNDGRDMGTLLNVLADLGYADLAWRVVDSLGFGVPQRRRRLFVVGRVGAGACAAEVLLECEGREWRPPQGGEAGPGAAADVARGVALRGRDGGGAAEVGDESAFALRASQGGGDKPHAVVPAVSHALTSHGSRMDPNGQAFVPVAYRKTYNAPGPEGDRWEHGDFANTQNPHDTGQVRSREAVVAGSRVRRLTPVECERLQGFPDGWTESAGSDSARYRCLGNAVTVPVAEWLGRRIVAVERDGEVAA